MYQKYNTEALILATRELGEIDKTILLYTRDFGLLRARASAVRTERSRMRYALQSYTRSNVSLVRGKRGWRIAGATAIKNAPSGVSGGAILARISELVTRLVGGEEKNEYLYAALSDTQGALGHSTPEALATIEIVCVARVLFALGYLSDEAHATTLFTHTAYGIEHLEEASRMQEKLLNSINRAIAETQL